MQHALPARRAPDATIVITTRNRKDELPAAVESALKQRGSHELLIMDDGSTDGTADMVRQQYPTARLVRVEQAIGLIRQRNLAARLARGRVVISIDDDAVFTTESVVEQTLPDFDHPRVAVVAIPMCNVKYGPEVIQRAPEGSGVWCQQQFIGTAHALRRDVFLGVGGYRAHYFRQGEERDLAVRLLGQGYVVRLGRSDRIDHFESPRRDHTAVDLFGRRNDVLFAWHNAPAGALIPALLKTTLAGAVYGVKSRRLWNMLHGLTRGYCGLWQYRGYREPVTAAVWRQYQNLKAPTRLEDFQAMLPAAVAVEELRAVHQAAEADAASKRPPESVDLKKSTPARL
jgi:glycosyltransferase involved in cell wall biosynthesis